jgi:hypothetical protein
MKTRFGAALLSVALVVGGAAQADEPGFLQSLGGKWSGRGSVRVRANASPVKVRCNFDSDTTADSMALAGSCTGLIVVSRDVGAVIKASGGGRYTGTYTGSRTGPAALSGKQAGNALNLAIRWAANVNGDRSAQLRLEKVGDRGMRLTTIDTDPRTGNDVVISKIDLKRL